MISNRCFNGFQSNQSSNDYIKKKKSLTIYSNTPDQDINIIKDTETNCLQQTNSYDTLYNVIKGERIYAHKCIDNSEDNYYKGENYQMFYAEKDVSGEIVLESEYDGSINTVDSVSSVVVYPLTTFLKYGCKNSDVKTINKLTYPKHPANDPFKHIKITRNIKML